MKKLKLHKLSKNDLKEIFHSDEGFNIQTPIGYIFKTPGKLEEGAILSKLERNIHYIYVYSKTNKCYYWLEV